MHWVIGEQFGNPWLDVKVKFPRNGYELFVRSLMAFGVVPWSDPF